MEWQPIETAPKDGFFLVCSWPASDWDTTVAVVYPGSGGRLIAFLDHDDYEHEHLDGPVTHWMPLPAPPDTLDRETDT